MVFTPEMYAWFTSLNIINPFLSGEDDQMNNFVIPEKTIKVLLGGKYMDIILKLLQDSYNKFYKVKMDFTSKMKELKEIDEDQDYISNSVKYANWHLVGDTLKQFGLNYTKEEIMKVVNGDKDFMLKIIKQIYDLHNQFLKHSNSNNKNKNNRTSPKNTINANQNQNNGNFKRMSTVPQKKRRFKLYQF